MPGFTKYSVMSYVNSAVFALTFTVVSFYFGLLLPLMFAVTAGLATTIAYRVVFNQQLPVSADHAILITGCSTGIGLDAVTHLSGLGYSVFAGCRNQSDFTMLQQLNSNVTPVILDVTKQSDIDAALQTITQQLSNNKQHLVALVNNAGYGEFGPTELYNNDQLQEQLSVNVIGPHNLTRACLPLLRAAAAATTTATAVARSSRIINISSVAGRLSFGNMGVYCASKHALEALSDALRQELSPFNVDVVLIEPGFVKSHFQDVAFRPDARTTESGVARFAADSHSNQYNTEATVLARYSRAAAVVHRVIGYIPESSPQLLSELIAAAVRDSEPMSRLLAGYDAQCVSLLKLIPDSVLDMAVGLLYKYI